ncbi:MAG: antitoxin family protein, partial [Oscillochloris sp.]|nr:antitoxin family protein [Oscillochloris sp.]
MSNSSNPSIPDDEREVEAEYRAGVLYPRDRLDLPDGTLTRLRVKPLPAPPLAAVPEPAHETVTPVLWRGLALLGALGLAGWVQTILLDAREWRWNAIGLAVVAVLLFTAALRNLSLPLLHLASPAEPRHAITRLPLTSLRAGLFLAALVAMTIGLAGLASPDSNKNWVFAPWLASIGCVIAAVIPQRRERLPTAPRDRTQFAYAVAVAVIVLAALCLRSWQIDAIPATLGGDEGSQGLEAVRVLNGEIQNPFGTGWLGVPTMSFYFNAPTIALFGPKPQRRCAF